MNNSFPNTGNGYIKTQHHPPQSNPSTINIKPTPNIIENQNHAHAHTEPGMTPLAIKKALQKQDTDTHLHQSQQQHIPNHINQPLLSMMSHGRAVNQTAHNHLNHNDYGGGLPPRPHSASGNLSGPHVFTTNTTPHVEHFPYGAQQGSYVNHVTTYTQQVYYPPAGGYYYYYPQQ